MKIVTVIDNFIQYCASEKKHSNHTILAYSTSLKQFLNYLEEDNIDIANTNISDINIYHIKPFLG